MIGRLMIDCWVFEKVKQASEAIEAVQPEIEERRSGKTLVVLKCLLAPTAPVPIWQ